MGKPYRWTCGRERLAAVDEGMSCRAAARRFGVAAATVIRWHDQRRSTGGYAAKPQGGDMRSRRIEAQREMMLALHGSARGHHAGRAAPRTGRSRRGSGDLDAAPLLRPARDHAQKKTGHAAEQDRPDVLSRARGLVRWPARPRSRAARVHRRNLDRDQHDPQPWPLPPGRAAADGPPARPSQDDHAGRGTAHDRHGCADGARRADQRRLVRGLCHQVLVARPSARRRRDHGQSVQPQACQRARR